MANLHRKPKAAAMRTMERAEAAIVPRAALRRQRPGTKNVWRRKYLR
jgi:hypothetical protein